MSRETITSGQSAQEALDLERERARPDRSKKERDGLQEQKPTPEAVTVLHNEAGRRKAIPSRRKRC
jgi:hypothetical protein